MTAPTGPFVYLSWEPHNQKVAEKLLSSLSNALPNSYIGNESPVAPGDQAPGWDVLVLLLGGSGKGGQSQSARQSKQFHEVRSSGGRVISVLLEGDPRAVGSSPVQRNNPMRVLREGHWDDDVRDLVALIGGTATLSVAPNMLPPKRDVLVERPEISDTWNKLQPGGAVAIVGATGNGKTVLAHTAARLVADKFPDGVLWANLDRAGSTAAAIRDFFAALGFDQPDPSTATADLVDRFSRAIHDKRVLIVLDDGLDADDVLGLLPPGPQSAVLVTGRSLAGFTDPMITVIRLGGLPEDAGLRLLRQTAGEAAVDADPASAKRLVELLEGSPLLLAVVGSSAKQEGAGSLASQRAQLEQSGGSRDRLLLQRAYRDWPPARQRLLRFLGVLPTPVFEVGLAAAIAVSDATEVATELTALTEAGLVNDQGAERYHLSELALRFAADQLRATEPEEERQAAVTRMVRWLAISTAFEPDTPIARDFWTADDSLGYAPYADAIAAFVRHRGTRPPLTIGVTAPWGAGKTSLMRMVQERLDPRADRERWTPTSLRLSDEARKALRGAADRPVTNRELLDRTAEPAPDAELDVQPPHSRRLPDDEWRPTVWFNPWMYQSGEQIWAGLAYEIITQVTERLTPADRERFWLALNLRRVDRQAVRRRIYRQVAERSLPWLLWLGLAVALALIGLLIAVIIPAAAHALRMVSAGLASVGGATFVGGAVLATFRFLGSRAAGPFGPLLQVPSPVKATAEQGGTGAKGALADLFPDPGHETRLGYLHLVQTDMRGVLDLVATQERPLVVFVDDLDRCSPGAVVQVIEAINLFLAGEFPHCIFVLAMEPAVVAAHVEAVYKDLAAQPGSSSLGWRFLEKIVQLPLSLPPPDAARQTSGYLAALVGRRPAVAPERVTPAAPDETAASNGPAAEGADVYSPAAVNSVAAGSGDAVGAGGAAGDADRAERVRRLVAAIRRRSPTVESLAAAALAAQNEMTVGAGERLLPETSEAANRLLVELYSDDEARDATFAGVPELSDNPREIKRFINLFRFYRFIAQQQQLQGMPAITGTEVAKLAVLAIRWPHLLSVLARGNLGRWERGEQVAGLEKPAALAGFLKTEPQIGPAADRLL